MAASAADGKKPVLIEIRKYKIRNGADNQMQRTTDFFGKSVLPAAQRAGITPIGFFASLIAPDTPFLMIVSTVPSFAAMEEIDRKFTADKQFAQEREAYNRAGLGYTRYETSLLRAFNAMPAIEVPPVEANRAPRVFELRTYESNTPATLRRKIKMFEDAEIDIFRRTGLLPVFFGETVFGPNQPNLTYMLAFDDLAAREKNWRTFVGHPDWVKLRATPGLADAEIVSNISNILLRPLPFSPIR